MGITVNEEQGVLVIKVVDGSPADRAGLKAGDVVQKVNGQEVTTADQLQNIVEATTVGNTVQIDLKRDGRNQNVSVEAGSYPVELNQQG